MQMTNPLPFIMVCLAFLGLCLMLAEFARRHMRGDDAERIAARQLATAKRLRLEHRAQAEYHEALALMYDAQASRLATVVPGASPAQLDAMRNHIHPGTTP